MNVFGKWQRTQFEQKSWIYISFVIQKDKYSLCSLDLHEIKKVECCPFSMAFVVSFINLRLFICGSVGNETNPAQTDSPANAMVARNEVKIASLTFAQLFAHRHR